jgi:hypothetical protein
MKGTIIAVGEHLGRWMLVSTVDQDLVYGRIWRPTKGRWTQKDCWYPRDAIGKKSPPCPMPAMPKDAAYE